MSKAIKTTKKQFEDFKAEFLKYQELLGLKEYESAFFHRLPEGITEVYGCLQADTTYMVANVYMTPDLDNKEQMDGFSPKDTAKHECIHLLLANLTDLGKCRHLRRGELDEENERLVRRLEKVL